MCCCTPPCELVRISNGRGCSPDFRIPGNRPSLRRVALTCCMCRISEMFAAGPGLPRVYRCWMPGGRRGHVRAHDSPELRIPRALGCRRVPTRPRLPQWSPESESPAASHSPLVGNVRMTPVSRVGTGEAAGSCVRGPHLGGDPGFRCGGNQSSPLGTLWHRRLSSHCLHFKGRSHAAPQPRTAGPVACRTVAGGRPKIWGPPRHRVQSRARLR